MAALLLFSNAAGGASPSGDASTAVDAPSVHEVDGGAVASRAKTCELRVEIRINELTTDSAELDDDPTDDYVTWSPTFCRARLSGASGGPVDVELTNQPGGGDVVFAHFADPWPVNATATEDSIRLSLPDDGSWVPFVIAGKFGHPSIDDKDAVIIARSLEEDAPDLGAKELMVRVRKNANTLTPAERDRFLLAWRDFRNRSGTNYILFQEMHRLSLTPSDKAHGQPAFLPWHRALVLHVERELQKFDPTVAMHYWNWEAPAPNIFSEDFMGAIDPAADVDTAAPRFSATNPLNGWNTELPFHGGELRRGIRDYTLAPTPALLPLDHPVDHCLIRFEKFGPRREDHCFSTQIEQQAHDVAHGWVGSSSHLGVLDRSTADPLFYLLHSHVDRQWAYWQSKHDRLGKVEDGVLTFPAPEHYDNNGKWDIERGWRRGAFLDDGLWPWDGSSADETSEGAAWFFDFPPVVIDENYVATSAPVIPTTPFPASARRNLWPAEAMAPTNAHMIDYLGRSRPQSSLGYCYDDVPFQTQSDGAIE